MEWMLKPIRRYADISGRASRKEFWMWILFLSLVLLVFAAGTVAVAAAMVGRGRNDPASATAGMVIRILALLVFLPLLVPSWAVAVRRIHDIGRTGWWVVAPAAAFVAIIMLERASMTGPIPLVARIAGIGLSILLLVFYVMDGTKGPNRYGPDPKAHDLEQATA